MSTQGTIFVVDDEPAVRDSLQVLLGTYGFAVETHATAASFLDRADPQRPGCLVADVRMPGMTGIELQRELARRGNPMPVIVITGHGDVPMAVDALKAGAMDFLEKPLNDEALVRSIRIALERDERSRAEGQELSRLGERMARLTGREREVMMLIVDGLANNAVAEKLGISARTVEHYRANIMQKMEASSFAELVRMAISLQGRDA
ncbi:MAG: response regulator transcription factor [Rhodospirillales bacterium]|nr:response regulator transcription factor [Rhodospirillales bacterium]